MEMKDRINELYHQRLRETDPRLRAQEDKLDYEKVLLARLDELRTRRDELYGKVVDKKRKIYDYADKSTYDPRKLAANRELATLKIELKKFRSADQRVRDKTSDGLLFRVSKTRRKNSRGNYNS
jgi:hypothetical protein